MITAADVASAVDVFLRTPKRIVGANAPLPYADGRNDHEMVLYLPLEVNGEQLGQKLMIVGFPRARFLKFRLGILMSRTVCRLDYTDETHPNGTTGVEMGLPEFVHGPHYHSWKVNRTLCRGSQMPLRLLHAVQYENKAASFDAILRWFCSDNGIEPLTTDHRIELPKLDRLFP